MTEARERDSFRRRFAEYIIEKELPSAIKELSKEEERFWILY